MKKLLILMGILLFALNAGNCATRVVQHTNKSMVIEARKPTRAKALLAAENRAKQSYENYHHIRDPHCTQETQKPASTRKGYEHTSDEDNSTWKCVIHVEKLKHRFQPAQADTSKKRFQSVVVLKNGESYKQVKAVMVGQKVIIVSAKGDSWVVPKKDVSTISNFN